MWNTTCTPYTVINVKTKSDLGTCRCPHDYNDNSTPHSETLNEGKTLHNPYYFIDAPRGKHGLMTPLYSEPTPSLRMIALCIGSSNRGACISRTALLPDC